MIPPEDFHSCHHCKKFAIDLETNQSFLNQNSDQKGIPSDIFFFNATLEDVLKGLTDRCQLCSWLDSLWGGDSSSNQERYGVLKASKYALNILVCAETYSTSLVDRCPVDEIAFFGLWEEDAVLHPHWGKCRVFAKCSVDVFTTRDDAASHLIHNRPINRFPGSVENLGLARQWLKKCQESHVKCKEVAQMYMPLRVLRISSGCNSCDFSITVETKTKGEAIEPYAALSYCWGGDQPYKTTKARMESGNRSLEWCKLPRSIQDAVKITSAIGLQYLWADSLCIVQDDEDDKALQIADMARVYSQASITIIASRASRAVDGFLGEIDLTAQTQLAVRVPFQCLDQEQTVGSAYLTWIVGSRDRGEPIDSRAWTLQERYLSKRVLEFGGLQTHWTCTTSSITTSPPDRTVAISSDSYADGWKWNQNFEGHASQMMYLHTDLLADLAYFSTRRSSAAWVREWLHSRWQTVLNEYTPRLLSVPTDRILGISGVAEIFLSHLRNEGRDDTEEYLAGMWKSSLPSMLCWRAVVARGVERSKPENSNPQDSTMGIRRDLLQISKAYQGPSWSWTGVNSHVEFLFGRACDRNCLAVLLDADIRLANVNAKCGFVTSGILTLKGRMRRSFWSVVGGTLHVDLNEENHVARELRKADSTRRKVPLATVYMDTFDSLEGLSQHRESQVIPVWLLEIGNCVGLKKRGPVGLVLEPVNVLCDKDLPRFRRLGLFHIDTRRVQETPQLMRPSTTDLRLEDQMDFFKEQMVNIIQLE
ncbi:heterokaryon incompatibility protein-domain-containing protein [Xylaria cubensis]|nr:heterokaryon incompatibility protein-domain-containing protein [Xylaria cubensis]